MNCGETHLCGAELHTGGLGSRLFEPQCLGRSQPRQACGRGICKARVLAALAIGAGEPCTCALGESRAHCCREQASRSADGGSCGNTAGTNLKARRAKAGEAAGTGRRHAGSDDPTGRRSRHADHRALPDQSGSGRARAYGMRSHRLTARGSARSLLEDSADCGPARRAVARRAKAEQIFPTFEPGSRQWERTAENAQ